MKKNKSLELYWDVSGFILWISIFLIARFGSELALQDSIQIPSVLLACLYAFYILIKFGLMDRTIVKYRNKFWASASRDAKREKLGLEKIEKINVEQFRSTMDKKSILKEWTLIVIYLGAAIGTLLV